MGFDIKLAHFEGLMMKQKEIAKGLGQGSIQMKGYPPAHDAQAKKIYKNWMDGRWGQLPESRYESGPFKFEVDSELTKEQTAAKKVLDKYVDEIDELKKQHNEEMTKMVTRKTILEQSMPELEQAEDTDRKAVEDVKQRHEKSWAIFAAAHPIEYSHITLLYDINNFVGKVAQWSCSPRNAFVEVKSLMREMKSLDSGHPRDLLPIVEALSVQLNDSTSSWPAFLKDMGEFPLKRMMKPAIKGPGEVTQKIHDFNMSEQQVVVQVCD